MTVTKATERVRHPNARRRQLRVAEKVFTTPNYLSVTFSCDDFEDFVSLGFDDHVKLFLKGETQGGGKPPMRDYTPRGFDRERGEFVIEFALHEDPGPATRWALECRIGDEISIGGPRGSVVIGSDFDWYWLIGDEAAIPAIARFLEERPGSPAHVFVAVASSEEEPPLPLGENHRIDWVHRPVAAANDPAGLCEAVKAAPLPEGEGFVWIAAEAGVARSLRETILEKGQSLQRMKARGYWTAGEADTTARFD